MDEIIDSLLPIGSVVVLNSGTKKLVIVGLIQIKEETQKVYDYLGVPYPEGFLGGKSGYLFNHSDVKEVVFRGYEDDEREGYLDIIKTTIKSTYETVGENE